MPVSDFKCQDHGVFCELATMDDSSEPVACPTCGAMSARIIRLSPEIFKMDKDKKKAHELNERNQHEPAYSTLARREDDEEHSKGCGCTATLGKSKMFFTERGEKIFPTMRPWMISH